MQTSSQTNISAKISTEKTLKESLAAYDFVIWVHSLIRINSGWQVFATMKDFNTAFCARWIAIIGDWKIGKTWLCKMLLQDLDLVDSEVVATLGLSVKCRKAKQVEDQNKKELDELSLYDPKLLEDTNNVPIETNTMTTLPVYDLAILDTQGTNTAPPEEALAEVRATDQFLRDMTLELAARVILVINKWDTQAQIEIHRLRIQLNNKGKPVTPMVKLLIVHNYRNINSALTLTARMVAVKKSYGNDSNKWVQLNGLNVYSTYDTIHFFLVNNLGDEDKTNLSFQPKEQNTKVIDYLRGILLVGDITQMNLMQQFLDKASDYLKTYLENWDYDLELKPPADSSQQMKIFPGMRKIQDSSSLVVENKEKIKELEDLLKKKVVFKLQNLSFDDTGVRSTTEVFLEGQVLLDETKNIFKYIIKVPGFTVEKKNPNSILVELRQNRIVKVYVKLGEEVLLQGHKLFYTTFKHGGGTFEHELQVDKYSFDLPTSIEDLYDNHLFIENGLITLILKRNMFGVQI